MICDDADKQFTREQTRLAVPARSCLVASEYRHTVTGPYKTVRHKRRNRNFDSRLTSIPYDRCPRLCSLTRTAAREIEPVLMHVADRLAGLTLHCRIERAQCRTPRHARPRTTPRRKRSGFKSRRKPASP